MGDTRFLKEYGGRLLDQGYPVVPIKRGYKFPKGCLGGSMPKRLRKR